MLSDRKDKRIAFLVQLPKKVSPGQRFRIEQYEHELQLHHISSKTFPFIGRKTYSIYYKKGFWLQKVWGVFVGFINRLLFLFQAHNFDYVFLQREATPIGPPIFEWLLAKVLGKKIILDFDDAIWIPDTSGVKGIILWAKCYWKVKYICKWSYKVSAGNSYLADWARKYNPHVVLIPTCVDTTKRYNTLQQHTEKKKISIGWTGSHSTLVFLDAVFPILRQLEQVYDFQTLIICDRPPDVSLRSLHFLPWKEETEIQDLLKIDIGIMPLKSDAWSEGKCGFKLIQYLALGIPAIASPVGVNKHIIEQGKNGFLCTTEQEWYAALTTLIKDDVLRSEMGQTGRARMVQQYSVQANAAAFVSLFEKE
jgi:glycosyltransferase involved in cell wall biosynthesis